MSEWVAYNLFEREQIKPLAGCYVIYAQEPNCDNAVVYVGQAADVKSRIRNHKIDCQKYSSNIYTPWKIYPPATKLTVKIKYQRLLGDYAMREIRLIHRLKPCFNIVGKRRKHEVV